AVFLARSYADNPPAKEPPEPRALPGVKAGGTVLLPNGWSLKPTGKHIALGDFPVNLALHPGGQWLAVLHGGVADHEIALIDLKKQKITSRVVIDQAFYGLCFAPDGRRLYASGGEYQVGPAVHFHRRPLSRA